MGSIVKSNLPPEVERAVRDFFGKHTDTIDKVEADLLKEIRDGTIDTSSTHSVRVGVKRVIGTYSSEVYLTHKQGVGEGAKAGRAASARLYNLDLTFNRVPARTLQELEAWSKTAADSGMSTITEDTTNYVRNAHRQGLSTQELARQVRDDLFEGRLKTWQAERTARTMTIPSSNAGSHTAYVEEPSVIGEEWIATMDQRTRTSHQQANGQIVAPHSTFRVGGHSARYPGDPRLPLDELVQCRCRVGAVMTDEVSPSELATLEGGGRIYR